MDRLNKFLSYRDKSYSDIHVVNGIDTDRIESLLYDFDWNKLSNGLATEIFHGDLQFDNVIYSDDNKFYLLDFLATYFLILLFQNIDLVLYMLRKKRNFHLVFHFLSSHLLL